MHCAHHSDIWASAICNRDDDPAIYLNTGVMHHLLPSAVNGPVVSLLCCLLETSSCILHPAQTLMCQVFSKLSQGVHGRGGTLAVFGALSTRLLSARLSQRMQLREYLRKGQNRRRGRQAQCAQYSGREEHRIGRHCSKDWMSEASEDLLCCLCQESSFAWSECFAELERYFERVCGERYPVPWEHYDACMYLQPNLVHLRT